MTGKKAIFPEGFSTTTPCSPGIVSGGFLFISGQVGHAADGSLSADIEKQTRQALASLHAVLKTAGCDFKDFVKVNVFTAKQEYVQAFNKISMTTIPEPRPTRATSSPHWRAIVF